MYGVAIGGAGHAHHVIWSAYLYDVGLIALERIFDPIEIFVKLLVFEALLHQEH